MKLGLMIFMAVIGFVIGFAVSQMTIGGVIGALAFASIAGFKA